MKKSFLRIRPRSDIGPKSHGSFHRILKSNNGIGLFKKKRNRAEPGMAAVPGKQMYDHRWMRWTTGESNLDGRTRSPCFCAPRLSLGVGGRKRGPRDQQEQRTKRASYVATSQTRVQTQQQQQHQYQPYVGLRRGLRHFDLENTNEALLHVSLRPD